MISKVANNAQRRVVNNIGLAEIRKERGLTQARLSDLSGVARVTIARYETGKSSPTVDTLTKLAGALHVTVDKIIRRKE